MPSLARLRFSARAFSISAPGAIMTSSAESYLLIDLFRLHPCFYENFLKIPSSETETIDWGLPRTKAEWGKVSSFFDAAFRTFYADKMRTGGNGSESLNDALPEVATFADVDRALGEIEWDWRKWIARGFVHLLTGMSGQGKSMLCMRIAESYIKGIPFPDGTRFSRQAGRVLWIEAEAAQQLNVDRAKQRGLPLESLIFPTAQWDYDPDIADAAYRAFVEDTAHKPDVGLIVLDSLSGANQGRERESEIIPAVKWLAHLAQTTGKPVLVTHHLRKRGIIDVGELVTLDRVRGHSAITQFARLVWALDVPDSTRPDDIRLGVIKSNLEKFPDPLGMKISESGMTFGEAPEPPKTETVTDRAVELLLSMLDDGPISMNEIRDALDANNISERTAREAKKRLGIVSVRVGGRDGNWLWSLPGRSLQ
jgi:hypothetical protein